VKKLFVLAVALAACSHGASGAKTAARSAAPGSSTDPAGVEVQDAIHGVRYTLPPGEDLWQVSREGDARSASGVETEVSSFQLARPASAAVCRDTARARLAPRKEQSVTQDKGGAASDSPRDQATADAPTATWSFTGGPASAAVRNRWAFFTRGAECLVLHVSGNAADPFAEQTFESGAKTFVVLPLPPDRQREVDLLAGMSFLERRDPASALERFEALSSREPDLAKAHFGVLMAGFELGPQAYGRALPHGMTALKAERDLSPEQRQLALRAVGVMQLAQNQVKQAAETLAELVVRAPDLAEGQYNYACALARLGDAQGALAHLKVAVKLESDLATNARDDDDLKSLRGQPAFEQLLKAPPTSAAK
jgi:hypothetical protein